MSNVKCLYCCPVEETLISVDTASVGKIEKPKRAVGSILNLIRCQPVVTLEEAGTRLRLLDEFAVEAFLALSDVENAEFPGTGHSGIPRRSTIYLARSFSEVPSNLGTRQ